MSRDTPRGAMTERMSGTEPTEGATMPCLAAGARPSTLSPLWSQLARVVADANRRLAGAGHCTRERGKRSTIER